MREIKFRAWSENAILGNFILSWEDIKIQSPVDWIKNDLEIMQYTGLKDKNGKEIYEGDIVTQHILRKEHIGEVNGEVIWYQNYTGFAIAIISEDGSEKFISEMHEIPNLEVIGNIYENPELLK